MVFPIVFLSFRIFFAFNQSIDSWWLEDFGHARSSWRNSWNSHAPMVPPTESRAAPDGRPWTWTGTTWTWGKRIRFLPSLCLFYFSTKLLVFFVFINVISFLNFFNLFVHLAHVSSISFLGYDSLTIWTPRIPCWINGSWGKPRIGDAPHCPCHYIVLLESVEHWSLVIQKVMFIY